MKGQSIALIAAASLFSFSAAWTANGKPAATAQAAAVTSNSGERIFRQRCQACHNLTPAGTPGPLGPNLRGVVGRKAGSTVFATYSPALKRSQVVWTKDALDRFLAAPGRAIPGTRMAISLPQPKDRAEVISYLETQRAAH